MAARSIEAGRAHVRTDADLSPLEKKLKTIQAKFQALGSRIKGIGAGFAAVGAGVTAIGSSALGGIAALSTRFADLGGNLDDVAQRTGISAKSLSELAYAAELGGTDLATLERSVARLQRGISDANGGNKAMAEAFDAIGLSAAELAKLSPEEQFLAVGKAIAAVPDPTLRAARAMELFGRSGTQLLPMLLSDIDAVRKEAQDLGLVISDEDAVRGAELGDALDRVKKSLGGIATQLGAAIAEPFTKIANTVAGIIGRVSAWVAANRNVVRTVAAVSAGLVAVGTVATGVGLAIIGLGATIASIGTIASAAFAAVGAAVAIVTSPITLAAAGIAAVGVATLSASGGLLTLAKMFSGLGTVATAAWQGIIAAIGRGDLQTAGQIAFTALEVGWLTVTTKIQEAWQSASSYLVNVWLDAVQSIAQIGGRLGDSIAATGTESMGLWSDSITVIQGAFDSLFTNIKIGFRNFLGFLDRVHNVVGQVIETINKYNPLDGSGKQNERIKALEQGYDSRAAQREARNEQDRQALARRGEGRVGTIGERERARAEAARQREEQAREFGKMLSEDIDRRRPVNRGGLSEAQARLGELQDRLRRQTAQAQSGVGPNSRMWNENLAHAAQRAEGARLGASRAFESAGSVGTFVSGVAGRIAGGGVQDTMKDAALETAANTAKLTEQMRQLIEEGALT